MTEIEALVALNLFTGIGSIRLKKLLEYFSSPQDILQASFEQLQKIDGIGEVIARQIVDLKAADIEKEFELAEKHHIDILTINHQDYPENLKSIYDPPLVLYVKGRLTAEDSFSIALVGSRRASFYGLSNAEKFAYQLSGYGLTVVSGLAYGVDTQAHKGALKAGGRTIAVLGSGLTDIYPAQNKDLAEQISCQGAVVSEFPIQTEPLAQNFPRRNRVISGLSLGVVVIEAARNSGALITADFALEQGRDVFALPGQIDAQTSFGTNALIKQGAKLVSQVEEIIEEIAPFKKELPRQEEPEAKAELHNLGLTKEESLLYNSLSTSPLYLDEIIEKIEMQTSKVLTTLLKLEMKKMVRQLPGKQFLRNSKAS